MIVSKNWLAQYVPLSMSVDDLTSRLTMAGLNLEEFHPVGDDVAIDLEVTSNRPDCLGHIGVAREVAALFSVPLTIPSADCPAAGPPMAARMPVTIECPELCHEYHARLIEGVRIGPSPAWLRDRLTAAGVKPVSNVVDVTNYVMLECGQPLHAFDADRLKGNRIVVRRGRPDEQITAIDQKKYPLSPEMCVIADGRSAVAIAGVMGGLDTEISDSTVNVLIEAASFDSMSVRSTARALKLHSASSYRFERRVDRRNLDWASRRCCELILEVAGGTLAAGSVVAGAPLPPTPPPVTLRFAQVTRLLGIDIPSDDCVRILQSLGLTLVQQHAERAEFVPPPWRADLTRECDLIEEVARIHGYEKIPESAVLPVVAMSRTAQERVTDTIRAHLTACGFYESMTLSFVSSEQQSLFRPRGERSAISVNHSSRSHENQLRQSLIPSLLQCRRQNERHGTMNAELFELARTYLHAVPGAAERDNEPLMVGLVCGRGFAEVLGIVETLVQSIAREAVVTVTHCQRPEFMIGRGAVVDVNDRPLGWIGELDRTVLDRAELQDAAAVAELNVNVLLDVWEPARPLRPLPRFPAMTRDLNFVLTEEIAWTRLQSVVRASAGPLLRDVVFGGQYRGQQIGADRKSYVVSCRFMAEDRTLTAEEVDTAVTHVIEACQRELSASLRK